MSAEMSVKAADQVLKEREERERREEEAERVKREAGRLADIEQAKKHRAGKAAESRGVIAILNKVKEPLLKLTPDQIGRADAAASTYNAMGLGPGGLLTQLDKAIQAEENLLRKYEDKI